MALNGPAVRILPLSYQLPSSSTSLMIISVFVFYHLHVYCLHPSHCTLTLSLPVLAFPTGYFIPDRSSGRYSPFESHAPVLCSARPPVWYQARARERLFAVTTAYAWPPWRVLAPSLGHIHIHIYPRIGDHDVLSQSGNNKSSSCHNQIIIMTMTMTITITQLRLPDVSQTDLRNG